MRSFCGPKKGIILLISLGFILVTIILAGVILTLISSQSRLTHHQASRIQAYYAAQAGTNLALENLRIGAWKFSPNSCVNLGNCRVSDSSFPSIIRSVDVIFCPKGSVCPGNSSPCTGPASSTFCINTVVNYTYTP